MAHDDKYVVFKREHVSGEHRVIQREDTLEGPRRRYVPLLDFALKDAVVMRTGDVFAHAALESYANIVRVYAGGVAGMIAELEPSKRTAAQEMLDRLMGIAGYFAECAQEAEDRLANGDVKVPD